MRVFATAAAIIVPFKPPMHCPALPPHHPQGLTVRSRKNVDNFRLPDKTRVMKKLLNL